MSFKSLITMLLLACTSFVFAGETQTESEKANKFFEDFFNETVAMHPEFQSYLGITENADKWNDYSDKFAKKMHRRDKKTLKWFKKNIDRSKLDIETQLSYDLFVKGLELDLSGWKYRYHDYPVNQMFGTHADVPAFLINIHQIRDLDSAEDYISRLNGISLVIDELINGLAIRQKKGILPPQFVFPKVIDDSKNIISGKPFDADSKKDSPLLADIKSKVAGLKEKDALIGRAESALINKVLPAYQKLIAFLKEQKKAANTDDGAWKFPNGEDFFNYRLKRITTTNLTGDEIHKIGLKEVDRIHDEMRNIMKQVKFEGNLQDFFTFMRTDSQFYYDNNDAGRQRYIDEAAALIDTIQLDLNRFFITKPKSQTDCQTRRRVSRKICR